MAEVAEPDKAPGIPDASVAQAEPDREHERVADQDHEQEECRRDECVGDVRITRKESKPTTRRSRLARDTLLHVQVSRHQHGPARMASLVQVVRLQLEYLACSGSLLNRPWANCRKRQIASTWPSGITVLTCAFSDARPTLATGILLWCMAAMYLST